MPSLMQQEIIYTATPDAVLEDAQLLFREGCTLNHAKELIVDLSHSLRSFPEEMEEPER